MGGKGGGDSKMPVVDYYMSVHFAICAGPVDSISRIVVKEKEAWRGHASGVQAFSIHQPGLFGGNKKEGGLAGGVEFYSGAADQHVSANLASRFRRTPTTMPGYRGVASIFFSSGAALGFAGGAGKSQAGAYLPSLGAGVQPGFDLSQASYGFDDIPLDRKGGFMWSSNNPYLPDTWVRVTRQPRTFLPADHRTIPNLVPEAIIGLPPEEEVPEDEKPEIIDAENTDPLNGYYIGALPTETNFIQTQYGWRGTPASIDGDPTFERRLFDVANRDKLKIGGLVYRNYGDDANPAHIILEAMTNKTWGMGAEQAMFNVESFRRAAQTLFDEKFGMSIMWTQQATIEAFVNDVLDHIQGMIFLHPRTGLFELKLIRHDYDEGAIRTLTPDNGLLKSFQRKVFGETTNEIVVTWTNPENEKESTVTLQDLANIAVQGSIISDARNYHGIRNAALAMMVCARDLRAAAAPLATFEAELMRDAWDVVPGETLRVVWPDEGIDGAVFRIMEVDYGRIGASTIKVKLMEEVFSLPTQGYTVHSPARPVAFDGRPSPLEHTLLMSPPYQLVSSLTAAGTIDYPDTTTLILAATANTSVESFELRAPRIVANGTVSEDVLGQKHVTTRGILSSPMAKGFQSDLVAVSGATRAGGEPAIGGFLVIGHSEADHEICMFEGHNERTGYRLSRGMLDTVPRAWPEGTPVWVLEPGYFNAADPAALPAGMEVEYKLLSRTASEVTPEEDAQVLKFEPTDRPWRPTRPANVRINNQPHRAVATRTQRVQATWANRNRTQEDSVLWKWTDGNASGEPGQTTTIRIYTEGEALAAEHRGLEGTNFDIPTAGLEGGDMTVRFYAEKDGLESLMGYSVILNLPFQAGYGYGYGGKYGE